MTACQRALEAGLELEDASSAIRYPVIVDALLGTGAQGMPRPELAQAIEYWVGVLARQLGIAIQLIAVEPKAQLTGDALTACQRALEAGLELEDASSAIRYPVIVDALLGTGAQGMPRPELAQAIESINGSGAFTLSLDLPSGLNANTGEAQLAVRADATVSFIARKIGLYTGQGPAHSGQRLFSNLGVGEDFSETHGSVPLRRWHAGLASGFAVGGLQTSAGSCSRCWWLQGHGGRGPAGSRGRAAQWRWHGDCGDCSGEPGRIAGPAARGHVG